MRKNESKLLADKARKVLGRIKSGKEKTVDRSDVKKKVLK